ncbi:MAG: LysR family transcriptional regulator [Caulobacter sp.]|nr:LysR family transcriptional regulator [Caulobacter sp.]
MIPPDLADLDAFNAVAQARGFRAAAIRRRVSASSLSQAVRRLEDRLGVRLLNRTTRSVGLTEAGARLLERLEPALGGVASALEAVNAFRDTPLGTLRLNVSGVVARVVLPPLLPRFMAANPGVTVEIVSEDSFVDIFAAGFDAGVRFEEALEQDMIAVPLGPPMRFALVAAPAYLAARGTPAHPSEVSGHACVRHRFPSGGMTPWEFEKDGEILRVTPGRAPLVTNAVDTLVAAAVDGVGLMFTFPDFVARELADGRLVEVLPDWSQHFPGPSLYYPDRRLVPGPLRAFVDFVRAERAAARVTEA